MEFDLKTGKWLEPKNSAMALERDPDGLQAKMEHDVVNRCFILKFMDPETRYLISQPVQMDVTGAELTEKEKEILKVDPTKGYPAPQKMKTGILFTLNDKLFWLSYAELRKNQPPRTRPDYLVLFEREFARMALSPINSATPQDRWQDLGYYPQIMQRSGESVLAFNDQDTFWGRREPNGFTMQRVPSALKIKSGNGVHTAELSPDGMGVRALSADGSAILEWHAKDGKITPLFTAPKGEAIQNFAYRPGTESFIWMSEQNLHFHPAGKPTQTILRERIKYPISQYWSPDGHYLYTPDGDIYECEKDQLINARKLQLNKANFRDRFSPTFIEWLPDSRRILITHNNTLTLVDVTDESKQVLLADFDIANCRVSGDGKAILTTGNHKNATRKVTLRVPLDGSAPVEVLEGVSLAVDFLR